MPYRLIVALLSLATADLASAPPARAQSVADADHTMRAMDLRMRALNASRKNLQQMETPRDADEAGAAHEITDADVAVFAAAVKVFTVAFVVTGVKCPDDVRFIQKQFALVVQSFVTTADTELARVNENLGNIATPGAVAEAVHIRDAIVELRDILKPFVAAEQTSNNGTLWTAAKDSG
jgi:hypothetical protein